MHRLLYVLLLLLPVCLHSQNANNKLRTKSHQVFVYQVNAATAEQFIRKQAINLNSFLESTPFTILEKDKASASNLPNGNYIFISVDDNVLIAEHQNVSNLYVYTANNQKRVQLFIIEMKM